MATFDRFDICAAHRALECDWNSGGCLQERPSNSRRREATHVQLMRINYRPARDRACSFESLENDNQREIYCNALHSFGIELNHNDETHLPIIEWLEGSEPHALRTS